MSVLSVHRESPSVITVRRDMRVVLTMIGAEAAGVYVELGDLLNRNAGGRLVQSMTKFRCPACGHWCNPADGYGWICDKRGGCGSEFEDDAMRVRWEEL